MKNKITVVQVVLSLEIGGMENVIANIARNIDKDLFRVVVICLNKIGQLGKELQEEGIKIILCEKMPRKISFLYPKALVEAIKSERADIVHSHSGYWHRAAIAGKFSKVKGILYTEHGRHVPDCKTIILLDRIVSKFTNYVIPVSQDLYDYLERVVRLESYKLIKIENGIDTEWFVPCRKSPELLKELGLTEHDFVLGCIARLARVKNHKTLITAFKIAQRNHRRMKLLIIGDGPQESNIRGLIRDLKLEESILLLGPRRDIKELLSVMDLFVISSISEGTSVTVLEAMAAGKPVIATNVGGNPKIVVDGRTGFLVPPKQPEMFARKVIEIADNPEIAEQMGSHGRKIVQRHFSVESMTKKYENLYFDLMRLRN